MIDRSPQLLVLLIAVLTLLGFVAGYCVASIRVRVAAREAIKSAEDALKEDNDALIRRESVLQAHLQLQTKRSNRLESQLTAFKAQRSRPPCDSDDSSDATSEQESPGKKLAVEDLPTLSRRVGSAASSVPEYSALQEYARAKPLRPLSSELEIPVLAESELPDASEKWQADSSDGHSSDRAGRRG